MQKVSIEVFDQSGKSIDMDEARAPITFLGWGFMQICEVAKKNPAVSGSRDEGDALRSNDARTIYRGFASLLSMYALIQKIPALNEILWTVVQKPSLFALLQQDGRTVLIKPHFHEAAGKDAALYQSKQTMQAYEYPMDMEYADGTPALHCKMTVVDASPPLHLCAGIISMEGCHPSRPGKKFLMKLLAARRGG